MRRSIVLAVVSTCLVFTCIQPSASGGGATQFFNGRDFTGWEGLTDNYWSVKDGAIVGITPNGLKFNTFLCSKQKYGDFELNFQVWLTGKNANSGVQIRSEIFDAKNVAVKGPQCDMGQIYWGSLYGEHFGGMMKQAPADLVKRVLKENEFNDYYIKCVGKHVTIKLNGETTVDGDFPTMPETGIIAWQLHGGGPMCVVFRKIEFKELGNRTVASHDPNHGKAGAPSSEILQGECLETRQSIFSGLFLKNRLRWRR